MTGVHGSAGEGRSSVSRQGGTARPRDDATMTAERRADQRRVQGPARDSRTDQRDRVADQRDREADQRDLVADLRERLADQREQQANDRDARANDRDARADARERRAELRDARTDQHARGLDTRERKLQELREHIHDQQMLGDTRAELTRERESDLNDRQTALDHQEADREQQLQLMQADEQPEQPHHEPGE